MLDRAAILKTIEDGYAARRAGDKAAVAAIWAPGATYRLAGETSLLPGFPDGPGDARALVGDLIDQFTFHELDRLAVVIEGHCAAIHWRVVASSGTKGPITIEICDFWEFGQDGRPTSLVQFTDTAALRDYLGGQASG
jgi:ketosteroid isomerase-like protein